MRYHTTIPQAIINLLTLLGSYSPRSFASTRTHAQHLHHLVSYALSIFQKPYLQSRMTAGPVDANDIENDTKEKIRAVLLMKTVLCTKASGVMLYLPSWETVVQGIRSVIDILLQVGRSGHEVILVIIHPRRFGCNISYSNAMHHFTRIPLLNS